MPEDPNPASAPAPEPAAAPAAPAAPAEATVATAGGLEPKVAAGLCCIFPIVASIIFLVLEKKDKFVRFWAMQSLLFGLLAFAVGILFSIAIFILGHMPFIGGLMTWILIFLYHWVIRLAFVIVYIISIVKAFSNLEWEIPVLGKIAREQLAKLDRQEPAAS